MRFDAQGGKEFVALMLTAAECAFVVHFNPTRSFNSSDKVSCGKTLQKIIADNSVSFHRNVKTFF